MAKGASKILRVGKIKTGKLITLSPDSSVCEAAHIISSKKTSYVVIENGGKPLGIFTETDIPKFAKGGLDPATTKIKRVMSSPVITLRGDLDLFGAYQLLKSNKVRHLVITGESKKILGVVTEADIIKALDIELKQARTASKVMALKPFTVGKNGKLEVVVKEITKKGKGCAIVEEKGAPIGMITERHIAALIAKGKDLSALEAKDVMSVPAPTIDREMALCEIIRQMKIKKARHLVVVSANGKIAGLVSQSDIVKGMLEGNYLASLTKELARKDDILKGTEKTLVEKTIFLDSILHSAKDLAVIATDPDLKIIYYNPSAEEVFDYKYEEVFGKTVMEMHKKEGGNFYNFDNAIEMARKGDEYSGIVELFREGEKRLVGFRVSAIRDLRDRKKKLMGYLLMGKNLAERRRKEDVLRESEEKYRSLFQNSKDVVYITDTEGQIKEINETGAELLGFTREELINMNIRGFYKNPDDREKFIDIIRSQNYIKDYEVEFVNRAGETIFVLITAATQKDRAGNIAGFQGIIRDITKKKKREEVINFLAFHDALTGLPNRRTFNDRLATELTHLHRSGTTGAVMFMDLDHFKEVNDTLGHDIGDQLLKNVAKMIQKCLREEDTVARLGGDEFTVILPRLKNKEDAYLVATKIINAFKNPVVVKGHNCKIGVSIGLAHFPQDGVSAEALIKKADEAMYVAKQSGRNNYKAYRQN